MSKESITMETSIGQLDDIKEYYGTVLTGSDDLKTDACCSADSMPQLHRNIIGQIDEEILKKLYGCGSPVPFALQGCVVLDLGCGSGRDVYLASRLVGPMGFVTGIDMTDTQLEVGRRHIAKHMKLFGYQNPNVNFITGYIEDLQDAGIKDNSIDVVISNCVINLSPDKHRVFSEIFRVLKPGGEVYFSDIFSGRRMPKYLNTDPVLRGECLSGALYIEDFRRMLRNLGCLDYRVIEKRRLEINNEEIEKKIGMIDFYSMTVRAFKLDNLEDICEDYGQIAAYSGTIEGSPHQFVLDDHHTFAAGKPKLVCGNTAAMLQDTRYSKHFKVQGNRSTHFGAFDCDSEVGADSESQGGREAPAVEFYSTKSCRSFLNLSKKIDLAGLLYMSF